MFGLVVLIVVATGLIAWVAFFMMLSAMRRLARIEQSLGLKPETPVYDAPAPDTASAPDPASAPETPMAAEQTADAISEYADRTRREAAGRQDADRVDKDGGAGGYRSVFARIENSLAGNWLVWLAGVALALGGVFLVKYALDQGLLGPWARVIAAALAGAVMLAGSEYLRRKPDIAGAARSLAPPVLAGAGLITLYGDAYAAHAAFSLISAPAAFVLLALISALSLFLAWLHGPVIAAFGIAGGFAAPLLIGAESPNAASLFLYVFAVTAGSLAVARFARWRWTVWLSLAGGAGWPVLWLMGAFSAGQALALAIYLPALAITAILFAWREAGDTPETGQLWTLVKSAPVSVFAAHASLIAACGLSLWLLALWHYAPAGVASLAVICTAAMLAAWRRESFALLPAVGLVTAGAALYFWPETLAAMSVVEAEAMRDSAETKPTLAPYMASAVFFLSLFGAGGYWAQRRLRLAGPMAAASAAAPVMILTLMAVTLDTLAPVWMWSLLLIIASALQGAIVEILIHQRGREDRPGVVAAYALGAAAAVLSALALSLNEAWLGAAIATEAAAAAWLWRRWASPALIWTIVILTALAALRLTLGADYLISWHGGWLAALGLVLAYAAALAALEGAARLLRGGGCARESATVRTLEGAVMMLAVVTGSIIIRLVITGGSLGAAYDSLIEAGLQVSLWLAIPLALRLRITGPLTKVQRAAEAGLILLAAAHLLFLQLFALNPWIGATAPDVFGPPVFNSLLAGYALPALLAGALAYVWRRRGFRAGDAAAFVATLLGFVWVTLETRRAFHAPSLSSGSISDAEGWVYSAVWLLAAALTMAAGVMRRTPILRYAALIAFTLVTCKVFLLDMAGLQGVWRGLSFLGLGAVLMIIAVTYQRVILPAGRALDGRATAL